MNATKETRRKVLSTLMIGGGFAGSVIVMPEKWRKPLIDSVLLPAHAETTDDFGSGSGSASGGSGSGSGGGSASGGSGSGSGGGSASGGSGSGSGGGSGSSARPPIGGVLVCDANGRNCEFSAVVVCGSTVDLGTIFANDAVRVILTGFDHEAPITIDTSSGNHSCNGCPSMTSAIGTAILLFSTGNAGNHTTTVTVNSCVMTVVWDATHP